MSSSARPSGESADGEELMIACELVSGWANRNMTQENELKSFEDRQKLEYLSYLAHSIVCLGRQSLCD